MGVMGDRAGSSDIERFFIDACATKPKLSRRLSVSGSMTGGFEKQSKVRLHAVGKILKHVGRVDQACPHSPNLYLQRHG